jgi:DNA-binding NarL/FixJ family response regulator
VPVRVLLIEDDVLVAQLMAAFFEDEPGYELVGTAASCEEALRIADGCEFDVIISDISIQGSPDGIGAVTEIRKNCSVPAVFYSGNLRRQHLERIAPLQPLKVLHKPIEFEELLETLAAVTPRAERLGY